MIVSVTHEIVQSRTREPRGNVVVMIHANSKPVQVQFKEFSMDLDAVVRLARNTKQIRVIVAKDDVDRTAILL